MVRILQSSRRKQSFIDSLILRCDIKKIVYVEGDSNGIKVKEQEVSPY